MKHKSNNSTSTSSSGAISFLKNIVSFMHSIAKAKSMAIRSKTDAMKARVIVFSLLKNTKKPSLGFSAISHKVHSILRHHNHREGYDKKYEELDQDDDDQQCCSSSCADQSLAMVVYNKACSKHNVVATANDENLLTTTSNLKSHSDDEAEEDDDDKYPDLRHSLFDEEDELDLGDPNASVIELVKNSREDEENFRLEDEIDQVADLFIMKFHKKMRLQKLESFKRYQEMLERSV